MESYIVQALATSSDIVVFVIAYGFWKMDRRVFKLENEHRLVDKVKSIFDGLHN